MGFAAISCTACGARQVARHGARFRCEYCRGEVVPRLLPGTLCTESVDAALCGRAAESVCRGCARPLCPRHAVPRSLYWQPPLEWRRLCPGWSEQDGAQWGKVQRPVQRFPVGDLEPFPWVDHARHAAYELGELEREILTALRELTEPLGAHAADAGIRVSQLCMPCLDELEVAVLARVGEHARRYAQIAYADRIQALQADAVQSLRYIEAFLGRAVAAGSMERPLEELTAGSERAAWDRCGQELRERLAILERLAARLHRE